MQAILLILSSLIYQPISLGYTALKEHNMFGTDGIRKTVGHHPFTIDGIPLLGSAIARWAEQKYGNNPTVLIGSDTRTSCDWIKSGLVFSLVRHGITVYDAGVIPTPAICYLTKNNAHFDFGIVISASHNKYTDNGVKVIDGNNIKLMPQDEITISHFFKSDQEQPITYTNLGRSIYWDQAEQEYIEQVVKHFPRNFLQGHTIVLDCANGAMHRVAPRVFKRCGARVISLHKHPSGENINNNCGSQHPESLQKAVLEHKASAGFAFDGDGDRVIAVNNKGEVRDGDDILWLLMQHSLYKDEQYIVGTILTNEGLKAYVQEQQKTLLRTPVGDKHITKKLDEISSFLGGEPAGHTILKDYLRTGDGVMTALRTMESILQSNNICMETFTHYPQHAINIPIKEKKDLMQDPMASIIQKYEKQLHKGRVVVRYSGTEMCLRIMVENGDGQSTRDIANNLARELEHALAA